MKCDTDAPTDATIGDGLWMWGLVYGAILLAAWFSPWFWIVVAVAIVGIVIEVVTGRNER